MKEKLTAMLEIKKIIAITMNLTFIYLTVIGKVPIEMFIGQFGLVMGVYFGNSIRREATLKV